MSPTEFHGEASPKVPEPVTWPAHWRWRGLSRACRGQRGQQRAVLGNLQGMQCLSTPFVQTFGEVRARLFVLFLAGLGFRRCICMVHLTYLFCILTWVRQRLTINT